MSTIIMILSIPFLAYLLYCAYRMIEWTVSAPLRHVNPYKYIFWHGKMSQVTSIILVYLVIAISWLLIGYYAISGN